MIRQTGLIIWDEVTMQNRFIVEAVDRSLRDFLDMMFHLVALLLLGVVTSNRLYQ